MRSLRHMIDLAHDLEQRGIGLVVLKQAIDTTTPTGPRRLPCAYDGVSCRRAG